MVDLDALEAAGIANARERGALIEYLDGLGFTAEEMVEAERRGRLFGLAGDAVRRSGRPTYSLRTAAEALEIPRKTLYDKLNRHSVDPRTYRGPESTVDQLRTAPLHLRT